MIALAAKFREGNLIIVDKMSLDVRCTAKEICGPQTVVLIKCCRCCSAMVSQSIKTKGLDQLWEQHNLTNIHTLMLDQRKLTAKPILRNFAEIGRASCRERVCQYV